MSNTDTRTQATMHGYSAHSPTPPNGLAGMLPRIDWQKVFIVTARALAVLAVGVLTFQYSKYFAAFGAGALAFIGQFTIGVFFLVAILQSTNGLQIMTAALGLYLLVNSF